MVAPQIENESVRRISFDGATTSSATPSPFCSNYISTTKYTVLSFLPKNLFEQFRKKANFYFLIIAVLSLMPFSPKRPEVSILPLVFVLLVSAVKEAFEDFSRYKMDRDLNNSKVLRWNGQGWSEVTWQEVGVGDLLKLFDNMAFPADILLLQSSGLQGMCTIETSNLDGETNLKIKKAIGPTCDLPANETASDYPLKLKGVTLESSLPNPRMDKTSWEGTISGLSKDKEALGMTQLLLRGCTLRNTKWIIGLVVFTGVETKLMLNNKIVLFKRSSVERTVDRALYVVFAAQFGFCLFGLIANWVWLSLNAKSHAYLGYANGQSPIGDNILAIFTYLILLDSLVPISLYVSMELVKFTQAWLVNEDLRMYHEETDTPAKARTSNLNEELGQVEYLFSDKTGTLTQNKMEFLRCCVGGIKYGPGEMQTQNDERAQIPMEAGLPSQDPLFRFKDNRPLWHIDEKAPNAAKMDDFLTLLAVCHSVVCEKPRPGSEVVEYQASSPDERALVLAAQNLHYYFYERLAANIKIGEEVIDGQICVVNIRGVVIRFEVLCLLEFNSTRKRMSVVVRNPTNGIINVFCKGADNVILERLTAQSKINDWSVAESYLREYAREGLRTLCCSGKRMSEEEFLNWYATLKQAKNSMENREYKVGECGEALELDLDLIGCTAIEDRLQDGVADCIASLAEANIKIWVLTGDKVETAINIGRSARLLTDKMKGEQNLIVIDIDEHLDDDEARQQTLKEMDAAINIANDHPEGSDSLGLVISGKALSFMFPARKRTSKGQEILPTESQLEEERRFQRRLLELCKKCKAVICCRVSPIQKAQIVLLVKENEIGKVTLAIGDGANDVPMIRAAHVGIGISGQEGLQAVMSSDYAIAQFRFLKQLLLVHGAWSYRRISLLINYSFYKNMAISFLQLLFAFYNGFSGQLFFDAFTGSLFNMAFTAFPVLLVAIFNRDVAARSSRRFPSLYTSGQRNSKFNIPLLLLWLVKGMFHAIVLFFFARFSIMKEPASGDGRLQDVWVSSSSVYLACLLVVTIEIGLETMTWVSWSIAFTIISLLLFALWLLVYSTPLTVTPDMLGVGFRMFGTARMWFYLVLSVFVCLIPDFIVSYIWNEYFPDRWRIVAELERKPTVLEQAIEDWSSPRAPIAKQNSALQLTELKKESQDPKDEKKRASEHLGYTPFQEDERDPDFVMGQEEFLHRSVCEDMIAANTVPESSAASVPDTNPDNAAIEKT